jgi:ABC-2 type transport system permease protein
MSASVAAGTDRSAAAGNGQAAERGRTRPAGGGWSVVARKELADHLRSARFLLLLLVLGLAAVVPLYFASDTIRSAASQVSGGQAIFLALFVLPYAPAGGVAIPPVYGFVGIVAPLLGVALSFDAINAERADGTLPRLLAQPIHRDAVIIGKAAAGMAAIMLALVAVVLVISGFGIARLGIVPTSQEILRVVAWLGFTFVWVALWLAFGLLLSVVVRRAATAALVGFGVWALLQVFGQLIVGLVSGVIAPYASATTAGEALSLKALSDMITRLVPLTLYQEGSRVLLNPTETTVSTPATIDALAQYQQQIPTLLSLDQSMLLVWPHVVALVALTAACFALAFVRFMRQEVRA